MLDLFDQDTSSYVVFGYPQKNVSEGRARVGIFVNTLRCFMGRRDGWPIAFSFALLAPYYLGY